MYALGHTAVRDEARWLATLWGCREGTVLSHATAAAYHRMGLDATDGSVHVSSTSRVKRRPGVVTHQVRHLAPVDVFRSGPFAVTRIPRTLVDLADVLTWAEYRALADRQSSLRVDRIREAQGRTPFRSGAPLVTRLVDADDAHTRSEFERRYLRFAAAYGVRGRTASTSASPATAPTASTGPYGSSSNSTGAPSTGAARRCAPTAGETAATSGRATASSGWSGTTCTSTRRTQQPSSCGR